MKKFLFPFLMMLMLLNSACTPVVVGGAAAGGYYAGKDERKFGTIMSDAGITSGINAELIKAKGISSMNIDVDTHKGVVHLYGHVQSRSVERRVLAICRKQEGVKKCISKLAIKPE
ncbi:MAG: BON domain-containing protein [Gammaproteobacteria bacterium]|jgi:osmotically-inducible protein OsmY